MEYKNVARCPSEFLFQPISYDGSLPPKFVVGIADSGKRTYCEQWAEKISREDIVVEIIDCYGMRNELKEVLQKEKDKEVFLFLLNVEGEESVLDYNYPPNFHVTFTGETYLWRYICERNLYAECKFVPVEFTLRETFRLVNKYTTNYDKDLLRHFYHACLCLPSNMQRFFEFREEILALPQKEEKELDDHYYWRLTFEQRSLARKLKDINFYEKDELGKIDAICKLIFLCPQHWWVGRQYNMLTAVLYSCALISVKEHSTEFFCTSSINENKLSQFFKEETDSGIIPLKDISDALLFLCGIGYLENFDGEYHLTSTMQDFFEGQMKNEDNWEYKWENYVEKSIDYYTSEIPTAKPRWYHAENIRLPF